MSSSAPKPQPKPGPLPPPPESATMPPSSWAKRTGFRPKFSGETNASNSGQISLPPKPKNPQPDSQPDLEAGRVIATPPAAPPAVANGVPPVADTSNRSNKDHTVVKRRRDSDGGACSGSQKKESSHAANGSGANESASRRAEVADVLPQSVEDDAFVAKQAHMKYELRDTPGLVPIGLYGLQHYLSILGSLVLIPLVIVPAMGGDHGDTSLVVSTVLFVSGVTTLLHTSFGSRLPLIQGPCHSKKSRRLVLKEDLGI